MPGTTVCSIFAWILGKNNFLTSMSHFGFIFSELGLHCYWLRCTIQLLEEERPVGFRMATSNSVNRLWSMLTFWFSICFKQLLSIKVSSIYHRGLKSVTKCYALHSFEAAVNCVSPKWVISVFTKNLPSPFWHTQFIAWPNGTQGSE